MALKNSFTFFKSWYMAIGATTDAIKIDSK